MAPSSELQELQPELTWGALQEEAMKDAARTRARADTVSLCSPCAKQRTTRCRKTLSHLHILPTSHVNVRVFPAAALSLSCCQTSSCSGGVSVLADLIRGFMSNRTLLFLVKSIPSWWELPSRRAPFVVLFTRTPDPPEIRIMCKLIKDGIKSTLISTNHRQQANVEGLSFQTNQQTKRQNLYFLGLQKKEKNVLNVAPYQYQSWLAKVTRWVFFDSWSLFTDAAHANGSIECESSVHELHLCLFTQTMLLFMDW